MEKDTQKTTVIFRKWKEDNSILALFPYEIHNGYNITCYAHLGQHSGADYKSCIERSTPATENEYKALKCELESIGYNLDVRVKQTYSKFLKAYHNQFTPSI